MHIFEIWKSIYYKPGIYDPSVIGPLRMKYVVELAGVFMVAAGAYFSRIKLEAQRSKVKG